MYAQMNAGQSGIGKGIRFGVLMGVALVSLAVVGNYVTQPISALVGVAEVLEYIVGSIIYGAIIGAVYRPDVSVHRLNPPRPLD
jgi:hypothetical protein